jgi:hypothetical protein
MARPFDAQLSVDSRLSTAYRPPILTPRPLWVPGPFPLKPIGWVEAFGGGPSAAGSPPLWNDRALNFCHTIWRRRAASQTIYGAQSILAAGSARQRVLGSPALAGRRRLWGRQALPPYSDPRRWCHRPTSSRIFFARCFAGSLNASSKEVSSPTNETSFSKCGANRSRSSIAPAIAQTGLPSCRAI